MTEMSDGIPMSFSNIFYCAHNEKEIDSLPNLIDVDLYINNLTPFETTFLTRRKLFWENIFLISHKIAYILFLQSHHLGVTRYHMLS